MKTRNFDAIGASAGPVDRVAARTLGAGVSWAPAKTPPACAPHWTDYPAHLVVRMPEEGHKGSFVNLTGRQVGRFTVVDYLGKPNRKEKARWLVRCSCGIYEARSAKAITTRVTSGDMCFNCRYLEQLKVSARS